jgi:hypothetical protein
VKGFWVVKNQKLTNEKATGVFKMLKNRVILDVVGDQRKT